MAFESECQLCNEFLKQIRDGIDGFHHNVSTGYMTIYCYFKVQQKLFNI